MSRTILAKVDGFTPVIDTVMKETSLITAVVFGRVWRYCQMETGVCNASLDRIANGIGLSRTTVMQHIKVLVDIGYLKDHSPDLRNHPHTYSDTGKAGLYVGVSASLPPSAGVNVANTEETVNEADTDVNVMTASVNVEHLKIDSKKEFKRIKEREKPDFVNLTVQQAAALPEIRIFREATGRIPGQGQWETVWSVIRGMNGQGSAEYLRPFWLEWSSRGWSASNLAWLTEWAVEGVIPPKDYRKSSIGGKPAKGDNTQFNADLARAAKENNPWLPEKKLLKSSVI